MMNNFFIIFFVFLSALWALFLCKIACLFLRDPVSSIEKKQIYKNAWLLFVAVFMSVSTSVVLVLVYTVHFWFAYGILFSALIINTLTDLEDMVIIRYTSLFLVPAGWLCAYTGLLPISLLQSLFGSLSGYIFLWLVAQLFYFFTKQKGMGQGDFEILALIGSFMGVQSVLISLFVGSLTGTVYGIGALVLKTSSRTTKIPFGPFLALGALVALALPDFLIYLI